jgi:hypothetical protein
MVGKKCVQIGFRNANSASDSMNNQLTVRDPAVDGSWRKIEPLSHCSDREELRLRAFATRTAHGHGALLSDAGETGSSLGCLT